MNSRSRVSGFVHAILKTTFLFQIEFNLISLLFPVEFEFSFRSSGDLRDGVGTTSDGLVATLALPDTNSLALHGVLAAEGADVTGVLRNFGLLDLLTQRGTVSVEKKEFLVNIACF